MSSAARPPFRIVASDMDGTVLLTNKRLSVGTMETLFQLYVRLRVPFIFATGRHYGSVLDARGDLHAYFARRIAEERTAGVSGLPRAEDVSFFLISSNGARVHGPRAVLSPAAAARLPPNCDATLAPLISRNLPTAVVDRLLRTYAVPHCERMNAQRAGTHQLCVCVYTTDEWYMNDYLFDPMPLIQKRFHMTPRVVKGSSTADTFAQFPREDVGKLCFICHDPTYLQSLEETLRADPAAAGLSVALSLDRCLDVMAAGVSKAAALAEVLGLLNDAAARQGSRAALPPLSMRDVISFGDSMNDAEMLTEAGRGCVMRNAQPRLQQEAAAASPDTVEVLPWTNDEDGVARKLRAVFDLPTNVEPRSNL